MSNSATPWTTAHQASLSITKLEFESVMPSNHFILCHPLVLLLSVFPSIRVFSNESVLCIRWPKHWNFTQVDTKLEITNRQESKNIQRQSAAHFTLPTWNSSTWDSSARHGYFGEGDPIILKFEKILLRAQVKPHSVLSSNINKRNNHQKTCLCVPFTVYVLACFSFDPETLERSETSIEILKNRGI